jgi:superfamily II DNA or RNA helicase
VPTIYDNIQKPLLPELVQTLKAAYRADFCVGYFNLRGWRELDARIEEWTGGEGAQCRLLIGMHQHPQDDLRRLYRFLDDDPLLDQGTANRLKKQLAAEFRDQLTQGAPTNADEAGLQRLARQLRAGKVEVKLHLRQLHAKLYLLFRQDHNTPIISYLGSSNLTMSGLKGQGELNVDVVDQDAANKLATWFNDRWNDRWCIDISEELAAIIEESWAGEKLVKPYLVYLKMAYHLSQEARAGLSEFTIPKDFANQLFDFQTAAVKIAARHLNQRGGVLIGDVVGLGKTIMASAVARIFQEDYAMDTLIICPKNLVSMWEWYRDQYHLHAKVMSISRVQKELPNTRRYRLVLIDESHNLRNREGKRYRAIQEYIQQNESRCILLSATPYNKSYLDLSSQLRLFISEEADLGIRPERLLTEIGEVEFNRRHQAGLRTLAAFEKSEIPDDWRELLSLFMVRRTRSFIRDNYATYDPDTDRRYLSFPNGNRAYFPDRIPRRVDFALDENDPNDQYARLYTDNVVEVITNLNLPRYGLGNYVRKQPAKPPTAAEKSVLEDLSRGGRRLIGFSRTNLFKRLESSGYAFLLSVQRHILRNFIFIHALDAGLQLPIGTQGAEMLDTRFEDEDAEDVEYTAADLFDDTVGFADDDSMEATTTAEAPGTRWRPDLHTEAQFRDQAARVYQQYATSRKKQFKWLSAALFDRKLRDHLVADSQALMPILDRFGEWSAEADAKLNALHDLLRRQHPAEKVLIFSQFADTVDYLAAQLKQRGLDRVAGVTGVSGDPTVLAWRFSPVSNKKRDAISPTQELRALIATDVLSEGQNLQDAHIVVNYDLPWAIIRLIQRAGRVDRIGQESLEIFSYTFWPAEGVERLIRLRARLRRRLDENAEVVGSDEAFFEDDTSERPLVDLYHETPGVLDEEPDGDIDLVSHAYQIWQNATDANPGLAAQVERLPGMVNATKAHPAGGQPAEGSNEVGGTSEVGTPAAGPPGVLVYMKTDTGQSALTWIDENGQSVSESQFAILRAARCVLDEPALPRQENHHELEAIAVRHMLRERSTVVGGQLGRPSGARFRTYVRLRNYADRQNNTLWQNHPRTLQLNRAIEQIYNNPLRESARERLNRQLRSDATDEQLADLVILLFEEDTLCLVQEDAAAGEPQIICSLGLAARTEPNP